MKQLLFTLLIYLTLSGNAYSQNRTCASMDVLQRQLADDPAMAMRRSMINQHAANYQWNTAERAIVTIPVVFHVVYRVSAENISDARLIEQINVLNNDFARLNADAANTPSVFQGVAANTQIQFCLATQNPNGQSTTGINRVSTNVTSFTDNDAVKSTSTGGANPWPSSSYLNIWVCNLGGGLLGYAQFPGGPSSTDGVVLLYSSVGGPNNQGTGTPFHLGRTATHEVGHWLNLYHIWGDSNCGNDLVSDTPTQQQDNSGCPNFPHVTCNNGPNGDMFMNYMDYTNDACMNIFTNGQATRMQALFGTGGSRSSLLTSTGCGSVNPNPCTISSVNATNITSTTATLICSTVGGATTYQFRYRAVGSSTWLTANSATASVAISGLTPNTAYEFQAQATCSGNAGAWSSLSTFITSGSSGGNSTTLTIGTSTNTSPYTPYGTYYMDHKMQMIITASELQAAGYNAQNNRLSSLAFYVTSASTQVMSRFYIRVSHTTVSAFGSNNFASTASATNVYTGSHTASANGWNSHTFSTPFIYNGISNLLIEICWNNTSYTTDSYVRTSTLGSYRTVYLRSDNASGSICGVKSGTRTLERPNVQLVFTSLAPRMMHSGENELADEAQLIPNPNSGEFYVQYEVKEDAAALDVSVYSVDGKCVYKEGFGQRPKGMDKVQLYLNEKGLTDGVYFCLLQSGERRITRRFVIQH